MNVLQHPLFYALLMCLAGAGIPVMAALNGHLGSKLNSPALATSILFIVGSIIALTNLMLSGDSIKSAIKEPISIVYYSGGLFVVFYIFSVTLIAPKFGIGNTIAMVLLGQIISMTTIDHFGLLGALKRVISMQHLIGLIFMSLGVYLTIRR